MVKYLLTEFGHDQQTSLPLVFMLWAKAKYFPIQPSIRTY